METETCRPPIEQVFVAPEFPSVSEVSPVPQKNLKDYLRVIEPYLAMSVGAIATLGAIIGTRT